MQTMLTWLAAALLAAALIAGWLFLQADRPPRPAAPESAPVAEQAPVAAEPTGGEEALAGPRVLSVAFPDEIVADGEAVQGVVHFHAPDGTVRLARFEVVEATLFAPFAFDPEVGGAAPAGPAAGEFAFYISTVIPQQVTLSVTLFDAAGRAGPTESFSFAATMASDMGF